MVENYASEDIMDISTSDLFIHVGGESDEWVEDVLNQAVNKNMKVINLMEVLKDRVKEEEIIEGMEDHHHHDHDHGHHHHHHVHRSMKDIEDIISGLTIDDAVKEDVLNVYRIIAEAEGAVHGKPAGEVHFHEVGTMDAVADVTAVCMLMREIAPEEVIASPVSTGYGSVRCAHGVLPVPAPATALILRGVPAYAGDIQGELCTPTGAALVKYFAQKYSQMPVMSTEAIGYGLGTKDFAKANVIRIFYGSKVDM